MASVLGSWFTRLIGRFRRTENAESPPVEKGEKAKKPGPAIDVGDVNQAGYVWLQNDWGDGINGQF